MKIIVGLGNLGKDYENTRHNAGKIVLDWLEKELGRKKNVRLVFPNGFMNNSGPALKKELKKDKLKYKSEDMLLIHDDLDIEMGRVKLSYGRSSAGHKGVESVIRALKTKNFWRLRIGVAPRTAVQKRKAKAHEGKDYLLSRFSPAERKLLTKQKKRLLQGIKLWLENPEKAMNVLNQR